MKDNESYSEMNSKIKQLNITICVLIILFGVNIFFDYQIKNSIINSQLIYNKLNMFGYLKHDYQIKKIKGEITEIPDDEEIMKYVEEVYSKK